jgi:hypothetical protein
MRPQEEHTKSERLVVADSAGQQPPEGVRLDDFKRTGIGAIRPFDITHETPFRYYGANASGLTLRRRPTEAE